MVYESTFIHINLSKHILKDPPLSVFKLELTAILPPFPSTGRAHVNVGSGNEIGTSLKRPLDGTDNKQTEIDIQYGLNYFRCKREHKAFLVRAADNRP